MKPNKNWRTRSVRYEPKGGPSRLERTSSRRSKPDANASAPAAADSNNAVNAPTPGPAAANNVSNAVASSPAAANLGVNRFAMAPQAVAGKPAEVAPSQLAVPADTQSMRGNGQPPPGRPANVDPFDAVEMLSVDKKVKDPNANGMKAKDGAGVPAIQARAGNDNPEGKNTPGEPAVLAAPVGEPQARPEEGAKRRA